MSAARFLLYAPNVHTGGGLVLLQSLLDALPQDRKVLTWLDARARAKLRLSDGLVVRWVRPSFASRFGAEMSLARESSPGDRVLCFHGLPPTLPNRADIEVFQQNRVTLGQVSLSEYPLWSRLRIGLERWITRRFAYRVQRYWVQTPSMWVALRACLAGRDISVRVFPFNAVALTVAASAARAPRWDFVYVADGEPHKNHRVLVQAWELLAEQGLRPSLALTLAERDAPLVRWIQDCATARDLRIVNIGQMPHADVQGLYREARALVFPSYCESFGLPLVEAPALGLPVLAGELDFVRDVCDPQESFDPRSALSIARAVRRFLGRAEPPAMPSDAGAFLRALLADDVTKPG
jgi:glycosyltransferase involved in cell wall biosynthesis